METYIGNIGHLELARLSKVDAGRDHCSCADGALIALAVEFLRPDVEDIITDGERCTKHDYIIREAVMLWRMEGDLSASLTFDFIRGEIYLDSRMLGESDFQKTDAACSTARGVGIIGHRILGCIIIDLLLSGAKG